MSTVTENASSGATTGAIVKPDNCLNGVYYYAVTCSNGSLDDLDGGGPGYVTCGGFGCNGTACHQSCFNGSGADNSMCASGYYCTVSGDVYKCVGL